MSADYPDLHASTAVRTYLNASCLQKTCFRNFLLFMDTGRDLVSLADDEKSIKLYQLNGRFR